MDTGCFITRGVSACEVRPLVVSRPSGLAGGNRRVHATRASSSTDCWPRPEWVEIQVCRGAVPVTPPRSPCYTTGSAWFNTQIVYAWNHQTLFCRILIDSRTVVRPAGVSPPHFAIRPDVVKHGHSDDTDHTRSLYVVTVTHGDGQTRASFTARVWGHSHPPPPTTHHPLTPHPPTAAPGTHNSAKD